MNEINCNSPITLKQVIEDARSTISVTLNSQAKSVMGSPQMSVCHVDGPQALTESVLETAIRMESMLWRPGIRGFLELVLGWRTYVMLASDFRDDAHVTSRP